MNIYPIFEKTYDQTLDTINENGERRHWIRYWLGLPDKPDYFSINYYLSIILLTALFPFILLFKIPAKLGEGLLRFFENVFDALYTETQYKIFLFPYHLFGMLASLIRYTFSLNFAQAAKECGDSHSRSGRICAAIGLSPEFGALIGSLLSLSGIVLLTFATAGIGTFFTLLNPTVGAIVSNAIANLEYLTHLNIPYFLITFSYLTHLLLYSEDNENAITSTSSPNENLINKIKTIQKPAPTLLTQKELDLYPDDSDLQTYKKLIEIDSLECNIKKDIPEIPITIHINNAYYLYDKNKYLQWINPKPNIYRADPFTKHELSDISPDWVTQGFPSTYTIDNETIDFDVAAFITKARNHAEKYKPLEESKQYPMTSSIITFINKLSTPLKKHDSLQESKINPITSTETITPSQHTNTTSPHPITGTIGTLYSQDQRSIETNNLPSTIKLNPSHSGGLFV